MTPKHQSGLLRRIKARFEKKLMGFGIRTNRFHSQCEV